MRTSNQSVLHPKTVLVESTGMQHWLNLQVAQHAGIAMNINYPMPTRYVWQLCRDILGHDKVPMQSTYKREVMLWRIERLLISKEFLQQDFEANIAAYWQQENNAVAEFKRVNLSRLIADTLEQYLMFRPKWLLAWENGESILASSDVGESAVKVALTHEVWQRWIWQALTKEEPYHPVRLQLLALEKLEQKRHVLPKEVYFFAINTMAPQTLAFFNQIAKYSQIHFFHLNPCIDYWGDAVSDRVLAKQLKQGKIDAWVEQQSINPLLRNFGQQGKDLFNLLSQESHYEISAFEAEYQNQTEGLSLLHQIQTDILEGDNKPRKQADIQTKESSNDESQQANQADIANDTSVLVRSCHSSLREVQILHDYLLQQFSQDPELSPKDVLVMCPAIENYSPYIEAVFGKSITELNNQNKQRIPCTIADRSPLEAEPLVAAFMQLLSLPDSRFNVNEFLGLLHIPAVMSKFDIQSSELDLFAHWIQKANIYWGLDAAHKSRVLGTDNGTEMFTWKWGIQRLMEGFCHADNNLLINDEMLALNEVEGQLAVTFGKLMQLLENLANYGDSLQQERSMVEWKSYLLNMRDSLFEPDSDEQYSSHIITKTLGQFFEHYQMSFAVNDKHKTDANSASNTVNSSSTELSLDQSKWSYQTIRQALQHAFASPDSQNQFMTGQVTFCSMMPMRSIPFKIIAVLGLNDGEFPRQSNAVDMDLVKHLGRELGDRSRRGDDRYLFLEAILSARQNLYLSYQGKGIKDNKDREPSLVLAELLAHLKKQYQFTGVAQQSLHPFSLHAFSLPDVVKDGFETISGTQAQQNFDYGWHRLMSTLQSEAIVTPESTQITEKPEIDTQIKLNEFIGFFKKPIEFYAKHSQGLRLEDIHPTLSDVEPFVESGLNTYSLVTSFTDCLVECEQLGLSADETAIALNKLQKECLLSGDLPDNMRSELIVEDAADNSAQLIEALSPYISDKSVKGYLREQNATFDYQFNIGKLGGVVEYHPNGNSFRHVIGVWIKHLIICAAGDTRNASEVDSDTKAEPAPITSVFASLNRNKLSGKVSVKLDHFEAVEQQSALLQISAMLDIYYRGLQQPLLIAPDLADALMRGIKSDKDFEPLTADKNMYYQHPEIASRWGSVFNSSFSPLTFVQDKYFVHYYPNIAEMTCPIIEDLLTIYQPLKTSMKSVKQTRKGGK